MKTNVVPAFKRILSIVQNRHEKKLFYPLYLLLILFTLSSCGSSADKGIKKGPKRLSYRLRSIHDIRDPNFIQHKLKQLLWDCNESQFIDDPILKENVVRFVLFYTDPKRIRYTNKSIERGNLYFSFIRQDFQEFDICEHIAWGLPFVESRFRKKAKSPANALGMFQFIPQTAREFGLQDPYDWRQASQVSALYVATLRKLFGKSIVLALAAYNGGQQRVFNAIYASSKRSPHSKDFLFSDIYKILPLETRQYPSRILAAGLIRDSLQDIGVDHLPEDL